MKRVIYTLLFIVANGMSCISTVQAQEDGESFEIVSRVANTTAVAVVTAAAAVTVAYVAPAVLSAAGFTASGIAAGSVVAVLQSLAATGGLVVPLGPIGIGIGAGIAGGVLYNLYTLW